MAEISQVEKNKRKGQNGGSIFRRQIKANGRNGISISQTIQEIRAILEIQYGGPSLERGAELDAQDQIAIIAV